MAPHFFVQSLKPWYKSLGIPQLKLPCSTIKIEASLFDNYEWRRSGDGDYVHRTELPLAVDMRDW